MPNMRCWVCVTLSVLVLLVTISFWIVIVHQLWWHHTLIISLCLLFLLYLTLKCRRAHILFLAVHFDTPFTNCMLQMCTGSSLDIPSVPDPTLPTPFIQPQYTRPRGSLQGFSNSTCSKLKSSSCPQLSYPLELLIPIHHITIHSKTRK